MVQTEPGWSLVSLSLSEAGQDWSVDEAGQVHMKLGSLELPPPHALPVWLPLDREREVEEELGEGGRMVEVVRLALSRTSVWALALGGQVYRRTGLPSTD